MNTRRAPDGTELAYRVLVDELPSADDAEDGQRQGSAMASSCRSATRCRCSSRAETTGPSRVLPGAEMRWKLDQAPPPGHVPQARVNNAETATAFVEQ